MKKNGVLKCHALIDSVRGGQGQNFRSYPFWDMF